MYTLCIFLYLSLVFPVLVLFFGFPLIGDFLLVVLFYFIYFYLFSFFYSV
ncbi:hypothetical protein BY996DRAFT_7310382 [Phakopsora pachyrhizi]|nr:hypothetical protein BY996DRAFT_7310382 [Phakopsora pachyrhizi]